MPFEKEPSTVGCERMGFRTLLLAAFLITVALLFAYIGAVLLEKEETGVITDIVENEAVHAFLGIDTGV